MYGDMLGDQSCENTTVTSGEDRDAVVKYPRIGWPQYGWYRGLQAWSERKHS